MWGYYWGIGISKQTTNCFQPKWLIFLDSHVWLVTVVRY